MQPLTYLAGSIERAPGFHFAHQFHQIGASDSGNGASADAGDQIVLQVQPGLVGGALSPARGVVGVPLSRQALESQGVGLLCLLGGFLLLARVYPLGQLLARFIAAFAGLL
ncbi:hypothetical protein D9M69_706170 [compost metagenome]